MAVLRILLNQFGQKETKPVAVLWIAGFKPAAMQRRQKLGIILCHASFPFGSEGDTERQTFK